MVKNPCMNCPKVGCGVYHDICPEYKLFREAKDKEAEERIRKGNVRDGINANFIRRTKSFKWRSHSKQR